MAACLWLKVDAGLCWFKGGLSFWHSRISCFGRSKFFFFLNKKKCFYISLGSKAGFDFEWLGSLAF